MLSVLVIQKENHLYVSQFVISQHFFLNYNYVECLDNIIPTIILNVQRLVLLYLNFSEIMNKGRGGWHLLCFCHLYLSFFV